MGSFSNYTEAKVLDYILGKQAFTLPANVYVGLFTDAPDDTGSGTEVTDVGGTLYLRAVVANNNTNWPDVVDAVSTKSNGVAITFPTAAAAGWGTVVAFGIFDDTLANGGNLLLWGAVTPNQAIPAGVTASFDAATLTVTLD